MSSYPHCNKIFILQAIAKIQFSSREEIPRKESAPSGAVTKERSCAFVCEHLNLNTAIQGTPIGLIHSFLLFPMSLLYKNRNSRNKNYSYPFTAALEVTSDVSLKTLERQNRWVKFIRWGKERGMHWKMGVSSLSLECSSKNENPLSYGIYMYLNIKHYCHGILPLMSKWDLKEFRSLDNENPSDNQKAHTTMK